ncbi:MAG: Hpt domain-containing protein [Oscillospiraceae bacterium]
METMLEKLGKYGADTEGIERRFLGDMDLYEACLAEFITDDSFSELGEALSDADYKRSFEHAHALKGVSGNMGLTPIYSEVCAIVEALRCKEYSGIEERYTEVMRQLEKLKKLI